jgi:hypothetical protein
VAAVAAAAVPEAERGGTGWLDGELWCEMIFARLPPVALARGALVCKRWRPLCLADSLWRRFFEAAPPRCQQEAEAAHQHLLPTHPASGRWHWGDVGAARRASGCRTLCGLWGATQRRLAPGVRVLLRLPVRRGGGKVRRPWRPSWRPFLTEIYLCNVCSHQEILRRNGGGQGKGKGKVQPEQWVLGVVQARVENCFLLDWPAYDALQSDPGSLPSLTSFSHTPYDLAGSRLQIRLSRPPPRAPASLKAGAGAAGGGGGGEMDHADDDDDAQYEIRPEDTQVLSEPELRELSVGEAVRVWEGRWDTGIVRSIGVVAHRVRLLGDRDNDDDDDDVHDHVRHATPLLPAL